MCWKKSCLVGFLAGGPGSIVTIQISERLYITLKLSNKNKMQLLELAVFFLRKSGFHEVVVECLEFWKVVRNSVTIRPSG